MSNITVICRVINTLPYREFHLLDVALVGMLPGGSVAPAEGCFSLQATYQWEDGVSSQG